MRSTSPLLSIPPSQPLWPLSLQLPAALPEAGLVELDREEVLYLGNVHITLFLRLYIAVVFLY